VRLFSVRPHFSPFFLLILLLASPSGATASDLATRLESGNRSETDKARDAGRQPAAVVTFLGIKRGMTVVDLLAAGGYYT